MEGLCKLWQFAVFDLPWPGSSFWAEDGANEQENRQV
jgi:hypothetical protein